MKTIMLAFGLVAMASMANPAILVPHGDLEDGIGTLASGWGTWAGGGGTVTWVSTGGNGGAFARVDTFAGGNWAGLVALHDDFGGGISLASLGLTAGEETTFLIDIKEFTAQTGGHGVGMKIESWNGATYLQNHGGDQAVPSIIPGGGWNTYEFTVTLDAAANGVKLVPVWGDGGSYGFDNLSVVPEPATMALLGLGALVLRRKK